MPTRRGIQSETTHEKGFNSEVDRECGESPVSADFGSFQEARKKLGKHLLDRTRDEEEMCVTSPEEAAGLKVLARFGPLSIREVESKEVLRGDANFSKSLSSFCSSVRMFLSQKDREHLQIYSLVSYLERCAGSGYMDEIEFECWGREEKTNFNKNFEVIDRQRRGRDSIRIFYVRRKIEVDRVRLEMAMRLVQEIISESDKLHDGRYRGTVPDSVITENRNVIYKFIKSFSGEEGIELPCVMDSVTAKFAVVDDRVLSKSRESEEKKDRLEVSFDLSLLTEKEVGEIPDALLRLGKISIPKSSLSVLIGYNGSGKTTLLNSLRVAASHFGRRLGEDYSDIACDLEKREYWNGSIPTFVPSFARTMDIGGLSVPEGENSVIYLNFSRFAQNIASHNDLSANPLSNMMRKQSVNQGSTGELQLAFFEDSIKKFNLGEFKGLLLIDEPEKGLDPWKLRDMKRRIREMAPQATVIVATHNPMLAFDKEIRRIDLRFPERGYHENQEEEMF